MSELKPTKVSLIASKAERIFRSKKGTFITVTTTTTGQQHGTEGAIVMSVTLSRKPRAANGVEKEQYSLYNLGIQGRFRRVLVLGVVGSNVIFRRSKDKTAPVVEIEVDTDPKIRGPYGEVQPQSTSQRLRRIADEGKTDRLGRIWFISFSGSQCTLEIISFFSETKTGRPGSDWAPPPPDPGGPYGEDEEPGDEDEEDGDEGDPGEKRLEAAPEEKVRKKRTR